MKSVSPGILLGRKNEYTWGRGTYMIGEYAHAQMKGVVEEIENLVIVRAPHGLYNGDMGDIIVGRVESINQKRWILDINGFRKGILPLGSVNLESGEYRRRQASDELAMRRIYKEGDLCMAEVQSIHKDGSVMLQVRDSSKHGKLYGGIFIQGDIRYVARQKPNYFYLFDNKIRVILGTNGYIWIGVRDDIEDTPELRDLHTKAYQSIQSILENKKKITQERIISFCQ